MNNTNIARTSFLKGLAAAALVVLILGCSAPDDTRGKGELTASDSIKAAYERCGKDDEVCSEVLNRQAKALEAYTQATKDRISYLVERSERYRKVGERSEEACSDGNARACSRAEEMKLQLKQLDMEVALVAMQESTTKRRLQSSADRLIGVLAGADPSPSLFCDVKDTGRVDCVTFGLLLAGFDADMQELVLSDIGRVYEVFGVDSKAEVLLACRPGTWGGAMFSDFGIADLSEMPELIGESFAKTTHQMCLAIEAAAGSRSDELSSSGGFSGVTGFDTLGLGSVCGMDDAGGPGNFDAVMDLFSRMLAAHQDYCETSLAESMMSGDDEPDDPPPDDPPPDDPPPDDPPPPDDDKVVVSEKTKTIENDDDTTTVTTTYVYEDGSTYVTSQTFDENGNVLSGVQIGSNADGWRVTTFTTHNADGTQDVIQTTKNPNGHRTYTSWTIDPNGNRSYGSSGDCVAAACDVCGETADIAIDMASECTMSGGTSYACQAFGRAMECCSDLTAFPADPRLVIPDPSGDLMCASGASSDIKSETCEKQCMVASYHEECYSNCMEDNSWTFNVTLLDAICPYAIHDGCFSSEVLPDAGPINPVPFPYEQRELLPDVLRDGIAFEFPVGVGPYDGRRNPDPVDPP